MALPLLGQSALVLGYVAALWALRNVPEAESNLTISALYAPIEPVAAVLAWLAARTAEGRTRRGWLFVAASIGCSALINLDWLWKAIEPSHVMGLPAYVTVYATYPLALAAFASFPRAGQDEFDGRMYFLDAAIVIVAGAVLAWHFVFRDILAQTGAGTVLTVRSLSHTVLAITVLSRAVTAFVRRPVRRLVVPVGLLTSAWGVSTLAITLQMRALVLKTSFSEVAFNACFATAAWLVSLAAVVFRASASDADDERAQATDRAPAHSLLPYAAIVGVFVVLLVQAHRAATAASPATTAPLMALVLGSIAVTCIVVLRQVLAQRRNAALVADRLQREAHFRALVQHASDVILVVDADGVVREASPSVARTLGEQPESLVGRALADVVVPEDRALVGADLAQLTAFDSREPNGSARTSAPCEWRVRRPDGVERWLEVLCTNLVHDPAVGGIVINGRDVSEHKALEAELTRQAYHDSLTGLVNRARFRTLVEEALHRAAKGVTSAGDAAAERSSLAVLYIDLDDFKPVNDALGHRAGDRVLAVVTERLRDATRGSDIVARLGGDEFAILLEQVRDADEAAAVARRVLARVQQPIAVDRGMDSTTVVVGASIGIACLTPGRSDDQPDGGCESLLHDADEAMYAAKAQGGRRYVVAAD